jgi:Protein of unknown function (DUF2971)
MVREEGDETVATAHPELFHYTTLEGLMGIVQQNELWATNIRYLNDEAEHIGYFDFRLPNLIREVYAELAQSGYEPYRREPSSKSHDSLEPELEDQALRLATNMRETMLAHAEPYVFSFSAPPETKSKFDGALSQWRAYGRDGGYALGFDSKKLEAQLKSHFGSKRGMVIWGDVEYFSSSDFQPKLRENVEREAEVRKIIREYLTLPTVETSFEAIYEPLALLSMTHKQEGFREEREVRLVQVLDGKELRLLRGATGDVSERVQKNGRQGLAGWDCKSD